MPLFDDSLITRFLIQAEEILNHEFPVILTRESFTITSGSNIVTLPSYCLNIHRVTYKGTKLDPLNHRNFREAFQSATQQSKPFWYVYDNIGQNQLRLFPTPVENITASQSNLYGSAIGTQFIVSFYRASDQANNITIPLYFRRRLTKDYVLAKCFLAEGKGQNIKGADYFNDKFEFLKNRYFNVMRDLFLKPRKLIVTGSQPFSEFPASPMLPINRYGVSVDEGY